MFRVVIKLWRQFTASAFSWISPRLSVQREMDHDSLNNFCLISTYVFLFTEFTCKFDGGQLVCIQGTPIKTISYFIKW